MNTVLPSLPHDSLLTSGFSSSSMAIASPPNKLKKANEKHRTKNCDESFEKQTLSCIILALLYFSDF